MSTIVGMMDNCLITTGDLEITILVKGDTHKFVASDGTEFTAKRVNKHMWAFSIENYGYLFQKRKIAQVMVNGAYSDVIIFDGGINSSGIISIITDTM